MSSRGGMDAFRRVYIADDITSETLEIAAAVNFDDDFVGAGHSAVPTAVTAGYPWIKKLVKTSGSPTVGGVSTGANGQMRHYIDLTSEKQEALLYFSDQLQFAVNQGLVFETRVNFSVLPTLATQVAIGLASAWSDGPDTLARYLRFGLRGNGTILCESSDGVTGAVSVNSGVTISTTTEWHTLRIDATDLTNVIFFIDGVHVAIGTTFTFAATGANADLQVFNDVYKASGAGVGTMNVDMVHVWSNRQ